ncbi:MAG TPA: hypothetical protein PK876_06600 [Elusimicrobiota bacterium]|nr:hypothetical protein [Elusimicrobiota bacterium]
MGWLRIFVLSAVLLSACASPGGISKNLNNLVGAGKYPEAVILVEKSKESNYGKKNALLYYLDLGMLQHVAGQYELSNRSFEEAKRLAYELFTKSVTTEASTFLVSDNMRPYYGEDFERALIHVFSALNYIYLGQSQEAMVEARQVDFLLTKLQTDYGYKNVFKEDPFVRYFMGMLFENQGELNEAYISYWKALEAYENAVKPFGLTIPRQLVADALRAAQRLGFTDEIDQIKKRWGSAASVVPGPLPKGSGELVLFNYNGLAPHKVDLNFEIAFGKGWAYVTAAKVEGEDQKKVSEASSIAKTIVADEMVKMSFPKYEPTSYKIRGMSVTVPGVSEAVHSAEVVEDIGALAVKSLDDRINRVRAKTIARAVLKFVLAKKTGEVVSEKRGELAGWLAKKALQVAATATEQADKRCWQSVPDKVQMARIVLPAGEHQLKLTFRDADGDAVGTQDLSVKIVAGRKTFASVRSAQ